MPRVVGLLSGAVAVSAVHIPDDWEPVIDPVDATSRQSFFLTLKRDGADELHRIFREVSDPNHQHYAEFLSWDEVGRLSRPSANHEASVMNWLRQHGVTDFDVHPHGDSIKGVASYSQIEAMTGGQFLNYKHKTSGEVLARMTDESWNEALPDGIETFGGFENFPMNFSTSKTRVRPVEDPLSSRVTPAVLRREFNIVDVDPAQGNIHAFGQFQGNIYDESDPREFCKRWNVGGADCQVAKLVGSNDDGDFFESSLDVEYINGAGQAVETWAYGYQGKDFCSDWTEFLADVASESTFAKVISISYGTQHKGECSKVIKRSSDDVEKLAAMGITIVLASGDDGAGQYSRQGSNCPKLFGQCSLTPGWPSSIPGVLSVGATQFQSEDTDSESCGSCTGPQKATERFGSGGGFSWDYPVQDYQKSVVQDYLAKTTLPQKVKYADGGRATPDIALNGDDYAVNIHGLNFTIGGTSASAPAVASMISLLNDERMKVGKTLGSVNALFYQHADAFTDITMGSNGVKDDGGHGADPESGWQCEEGWDAVTGLGTPDFSRLLAIVKDLNMKDLAKGALV